MKIFIHDFETRSLADLEEEGASRYFAHPSTKVLMLSYRFDDGPVQVWEPHKNPEIPQEVLEAMCDPNVLKVAFNAPFEMDCWEKLLHIEVDQSEWCDVMILARYLSISGTLEDVGKIVGLPADKVKDARGKKLIKMFSYPCHLGGVETLFGVTEPAFHDHQDKPREWEEFVEYCRQDTVAEHALFRMFESFLLPMFEQQNWELDREINQRGMPVSAELVKKGFELAQRSQTRIIDLLNKLTGLQNPNSRDQLLPWLQKNGYPYASLKKEWVQKALKSDKPNLDCKRALLYRQQSSKTSFKKLAAIVNHLDADGRLRYLFAFMGAPRTARWAGRGVQFQNLPRPTKAVEKNLDVALALIMALDEQGIIEKFVEVDPIIGEKIPSVIDVVSSCIRSAFQASVGNKLLVADLNAIENRVLGWLADCDAINRVFREGRCPYMNFAAEAMYKIPYMSMVKPGSSPHKPIDEIASAKRQTAKPAVLGAGYELGHGTELVCPDCEEVCGKRTDASAKCPYCGTQAIRRARTHKDKWGNIVKEGLIAYAENQGITLTPDEAFLAVTSFRTWAPEVASKPTRENPNAMPGLWWKLEHAAKTVIKDGGKVQVGFVEFSCIRRKNNNGQIMRIKLPSGRYLHYLNARMEPYTYTDASGRERESTRIAYDGIGHGVGATTDQVKWGTVYTYGGKLAENIVQAISRDILCDIMKRIARDGGKICGHVHDEVICEQCQDDSWFTYADMIRIMTAPIDWAPGLLLGADGYEGQIYKKG